MQAIGNMPWSLECAQDPLDGVQRFLAEREIFQRRHATFNLAHTAGADEGRWAYQCENPPEGPEDTCR